MHIYFFHTTAYKSGNPQWFKRPSSLADPVPSSNPQPQVTRVQGLWRSKSTLWRIKEWKNTWAEEIQGSAPQYAACIAAKSVFRPWVVFSFLLFKWVAHRQDVQKHSFTFFIIIITIIFIFFNYMRVSVWSFPQTEWAVAAGTVVVVCSSIKFSVCGHLNACVETRALLSLLGQMHTGKNIPPPYCWGVAQRESRQQQQAADSPCLSSLSSLSLLSLRR